MRSVTVKQIKGLDRRAIEDFKIPSIVLMENAGRAVADEALRLIKKIKDPFACVVCGVGNNAGDGFVVARHLLNNKIKTKIFIIGKIRNLKSDSAHNYRILKGSKAPIRNYKKSNRIFSQNIEKADVVIDAIFGVGLNRNIEEPFKSAIEELNKKAKRIISVDIPSGLDGTSGKIYGACVQANTTVTFTFPKKGFYKNNGLRFVGKIVIKDIGIPEKLKNGF